MIVLIDFSEMLDDVDCTEETPEGHIAFLSGYIDDLANQVAERDRRIIELEAMCYWLRAMLPPFGTD